MILILEILSFCWKVIVLLILVREETQRVLQSLLADKNEGIFPDEREVIEIIIIFIIY